MQFSVTALTVALAVASSSVDAFAPVAKSTTSAFVGRSNGNNHHHVGASSIIHPALQMGLLDTLFSKKKKSKEVEQEKKKTPTTKETTTTSKAATTTVSKPTITEVQSLFSLWNEALATLDSDIVAQRYAKDAVLLPTVSDTPRDSYDSIKDYFDAFLQKKPRGKILESHVTIGDNGSWCQDNGIYEFTMQTSGDVVKARYSFFYVKDDSTNGDWKISHHHSSQMPEEVVSNVPCMTKEDCHQLFQLWNDALATKDPKIVAQRYTKDAVLLPTVSDVPRTSTESIEAYFVDFLKKEPQGTIEESFVTVGSDWCQDSGIYEFTLQGGAKVRARYSFVYVKEDGAWKIAHHHSSQMPEEVQSKGTLEKEAKANEGVPDTLDDEKQVRALFKLWNDALATGDAKQVAARYSKKSAILLPTVSDEPRTDEASITDYFVNFLKLKPQGVITDGTIVCGKGWCQDAGVYEFTMGANKDETVKARYSFVYVLEDGEWRIAHHHSSKMPEPMLKERAKLDEEMAEEHKTTHLSEKEVRGMFDKWNKALKTKDPKKVAALYHPDALLLPTVSDVPRKTPAAIEDYFVSFLKNEPQGVIEEETGVILTGKNYAEDAGVYEFTMGASGDKVKARYSFVYTRDEKSGEWKISHHHSSAMPEAMFDAANKAKLVEEILFPKKA